MSDNVSTVEETNVEQPAGDDDPKGLRKQLADAHATIKEMKAEKMAESFTKIGLDPTQGLGKAIAKEYDGDPSPEALAEYAKNEYGFEGPTDSTNPLAPAIAQGQAKLDALNETAGSVATPSQQDILAKAEAEGDVDTSLAIKSQEIESWFAGGQQ